jgi:hypothetical protein
MRTDILDPRFAVVAARIGALLHGPLGRRAVVHIRLNTGPAVGP